ncbi:MAG TPA: SSI family serine proteinase inhibitor [Streptosporangiaceae bacterium]|jgi:hypothetical protein
MTHEKLPATRRSRTLVATARCLLAAGTLAVAACGSVAAPSAAPAKPKVSLTITVQGAPGKPARHWTLQCDPAGGTHPDPAAACRALKAVKDPFAPPPAGHMCPMILASAGRAIFNGTYYGVKVHRTIMDGGCYLARWSKLHQVIN